MMAPQYVTVSPGAPVQYFALCAVSPPGASVVTYLVAAEDAFGNPIAGYPRLVRFTNPGGKGLAPGTYALPPGGLSNSAESGPFALGNPVGAFWTGGPTLIVPGRRPTP
jgi:hypothetical protein